MSKHINFISIQIDHEILTLLLIAENFWHIKPIVVVMLLHLSVFFIELCWLE